MEIINMGGQISYVDFGQFSVGVYTIFRLLCIAWKFSCKKRTEAHLLYTHIAPLFDMFTKNLLGNRVTFFNQTFEKRSQNLLEKGQQLTVIFHEIFAAKRELINNFNT